MNRLILPQFIVSVLWLAACYVGLETNFIQSRPDISFLLPLGLAFVMWFFDEFGAAAIIIATLAITTSLVDGLFATRGMIILSGLGLAVASARVTSILEGKGAPPELLNRTFMKRVLPAFVVQYLLVAVIAKWGPAIWNTRASLAADVAL